MVVAWLPEQLVDQAELVMWRVFKPRLMRPGARFQPPPVCEALAQEYLSDPVKLALGAAAQVSAGKVKLSVVAAERSCGTPLLGALAIPAGEAIDVDPLRLVVLLGVSLAFDVEPSGHAPGRVRFG